MDVRQAVGREIGWVSAQAADDVQTIKRIAAGDRPALADLYVRYRPALPPHLLNFPPPPGLAVELRQDTLGPARQNTNPFQSHSSAPPTPLPLPLPPPPT